ncbi:MAG: HAD-IIIA family hydrolase [Bacteroidetes bacterium]|nr:HAD-IIIA family hydrolase [Bacteroidota bacterium]
MPYEPSAQSSFLRQRWCVNIDPGDYTYKVEKVDMVEGIVEALRELKKRGYEFIVITNQGGIAKGLYSYDDVKAVNKAITSFLGDRGIAILDIYYCPHHTDYGKCLCRKPDSLLLEKAAARYGVDKSKSYFVGDKQRDIDAGEKAGIEGVLIGVNEDLGNYLNRFC